MILYGKWVGVSVHIVARAGVCAQWIHVFFLFAKKHKNQAYIDVKWWCKMVQISCELFGPTRVFPKDHTIQERRLNE